jgi:hypothetical protein
MRLHVIPDLRLHTHNNVDTPPNVPCLDAVHKGGDVDVAPFVRPPFDVRSENIHRAKDSFASQGRSGGAGASGYFRIESNHVTVSSVLVSTFRAWALAADPSGNSDFPGYLD